MPHVVVKMHAGKTPEQKAEFSAKIRDVFMETLSIPEKFISVSVEDYDPKDWAGVYQEEITDKPETLIIGPGYDGDMFS